MHALESNVAAVCEICAVDWRVYDVVLASMSPHTLTDSTQSAASHFVDVNKPQLKATVDSQQREEKIRHLRNHMDRLSYLQFLCCGDVSNDLVQLWVFNVNNRHSIASLDSASDLSVSTIGSWNSTSKSMTKHVEKRLCEAIQIHWLGIVTAASSEFQLRLLKARSCKEATSFAHQDLCIAPKHDCTPVRRHFAMHYLFESVDILKESTTRSPVFRFHFQLENSLSNKKLCVNIEMAMCELELSCDAEEHEESEKCISNPHREWLRAMGLPSTLEPSIVDVWHFESCLPAQIIAQTLYRDVVPQFERRDVSKRREEDDGKGLRMDTSLDADTDEKDSNGAEIEQDATVVNDGDNGELDEVSTVTSRHAKRKISALKKFDRERCPASEHITPTSPNLNVNYSSTSGSMTVLALPQSHSQMKTDLTVTKDVQIYRKRRRRRYKCSSVSPLLPNKSRSEIPISHGELKADIFSIRSPGNHVAPLCTPALSPEHVGDKSIFAKNINIEHPLLAALGQYANGSSTTLKADASYKDLRDVPSRKPKKKKQLIPAMYAAHMSSDVTFTRKYCLSKKRLEVADRDRERQLEFANDPERVFLQLEKYHSARCVDTNATSEQILNQCIHLGLQQAAKDIAGGYDQPCFATPTWQSICPSSFGYFGKTLAMRLYAMRDYDKRIWAEKISPYINELQASFVGSASDVDTEEGVAFSTNWMSLDQYAQRKALNPIVETPVMVRVPLFTMADTQSTFHLPAYAVSEWNLRSLHPVTAPKNVNYAIVCPHSVSEWLAALTLAYVSSFKNHYANYCLGKQNPLSMAQAHSNPSVTIDQAKALLLVSASTSASDVFSPFRIAGAKLHSLVRNGVKQQAFSECNYNANVIYIVAPFRRNDLKHKYWLLGSFLDGLYKGSVSSPDYSNPESAFQDILWIDSIAVELIYLEDLYSACLDPSPFYFLPTCLSLYNRIAENRKLIPVPKASVRIEKSRYVIERAYHLALEKREEATAMVYASYALSMDGRYMICSWTDSIGSMLEVFTVPLVDTVELRKAQYIKVLDRWLELLALHGEKSVLVITHLQAQVNDATADDNPQWNLWKEVFSDPTDSTECNLLEKYSLVLSQIVLTNIKTLSRDRVQLRNESQWNEICAARNQRDCTAPFAYEFVVLDDDIVYGYLAISPTEPALHHGPHSGLSRSIDTCNASILRYQKPDDNRDFREPIIFVTQLQLIKNMSDESKSNVALDSSSQCGIMHRINSNFASLSYLTLHPTSLQRQSPYPLHISALDKLRRELSHLQHQLRQ